MGIQVIEPRRLRGDSQVELDALRQRGYRAADLHAHTSCSHDVLPLPQFAPEALYQRALQREMDYISFTDHDTMDAYDAIGWQRPRLVTGVEISLIDPTRVGHTIHVNVFDLDRRQFRELEEIAKRQQDFERFVAYLRHEGLPCVYNHPFWAEPHERLSYTSVEAVARELPVIEVNAKRIRELNLLTLALGQRYARGVVACGDSHVGEVGESYTLAQGDTFREWFHQVAQAEVVLHAQHLDEESLNSEITRWRELLFDGGAPLPASADITGNWVVDRMMRFFANRAQDRRLLLVMPAFRGLVRELTDSGLPSALYLYGQSRSARDLARAHAAS
jgi:hypothetical protein